MPSAIDPTKPVPGQPASKAVDGSKVDANASKHRSVTCQRAGELSDQLKLEIAALLARAEAADASGEEDPRALPKEIARREALRAKLDAARQRLESQECAHQVSQHLTGRVLGQFRVTNQAR